MCLWTVDADNIDKIDADVLGVVLRNRPVRNFLDPSNKKLGVAGIKGQGKTFLLKIKLRNAREVGELCIPKDRLLDSLDSSIIGAVNGGVLSCLGVYDYWVDAWKLSIGLSVILHCGMAKEARKRLGWDQSHFTRCVLDGDYGSMLNPTQVLAELVKQEKAEFIRALDDAFGAMSEMRQISQSVCVFIDKVDQTFDAVLAPGGEDSGLPRRVRNKEIWYYAQTGLAMASYEIKTNVSDHVKVFYSIRLEALQEMGHTTPKVRNRNSFITRLSYSKQDLHDMYEMYIQAEDEGDLKDKAMATTNPSVAFVGIAEVQVRTKVEDGNVSPEVHSERVFDYIYRHTLKRPQDLMKICANLSNSLGHLDNEAIRRIVNQTSDEILEEYVKELSTFTTMDVGGLAKLEMMFPGDLLDADAVKEVCDRFNRGEGSDRGCNLDCKRCHQSKPLASLVNIGLIGEVVEREDGTQRQVFKDAGTSSVSAIGQFVIRQGMLYVLHPCLSSASFEKRNNLGHVFHYAPKFVPGDDEQYDSSIDRRKYFDEVQKTLRRERVFVSSTVNDMGEEREVARHLLVEKGFNPVMSELASFGTKGTEDANSHDHCIDKALGCGSLISFMGHRFGGVYAGRKYKTHADELGKALSAYSGGVVTYPSVSLMELYVMLKEGNTCRMFISDSLRHAIQRKDYSVVEESVKVEYQFINHMDLDGDGVKGNWISGYSNLDNLRTHLANMVL